MVSLSTTKSLSKRRIAYNCTLHIWKKIEYNLSIYTIVVRDRSISGRNSRAKYTIYCRYIKSGVEHKNLIPLTNIARRGGFQMDNRDELYWQHNIMPSDTLGPLIRVWDGFLMGFNQMHSWGAAKRPKTRSVSQRTSKNHYIT